MATRVFGLTPKQHALLVKKFGYESYPNGEGGFTREAVRWLEESFPAKLKTQFGGCAALAAEARIKKPYFTHKQIKFLKS